MELRVVSADNSAPDQHSLYPFGQHTFAFYNKCVAPVRLTDVARSADFIYYSIKIEYREWVHSSEINIPK